MQKSYLITKIRLGSKFMMPQSGKQTIVIHLLFNISWSKGNQTVKFGQLIEYYMSNFFLEMSCKKYSGQTISGFFSKK